jgi:hypothetical protein
MAVDMVDQTATGGWTLDGAGPHRVEAAQLFMVLHRDDVRRPGSRHVLAGVQRVHIGRGTSSARRVSTGLTIAIDDDRASRAHVELRALRGGWVLSDTGSRNGTWVNGERVERVGLTDGAIIEIGKTFFCYRAPRLLPMGLPADTPERGIDAPHALWRSFHVPLIEGGDQLAALAPTALNVLVQGPTGAGKERIAEGLHALSARPGALNAINCATLGADLADSALFGHVRGAFTGAGTSRPGLFAQSDRGTVFLDEVGELPLAVQARLLRVIETGVVRPVGADTARQVDVRIVSATHRPLLEAVAAGRFREDLYARLASYVFEVPALAQRPEDLGILLRALLPASVSALRRPAAWAILRHDWPRNVRALKNALEVAAALSQGAPIEAAHLPAEVRQTSAVEPASGTLDPRHQALLAALADCRGNVAEAARRLGKSRNTTHRWLKQFGIDPERYR